MKLSRLCLGTAQLGMIYGINNEVGKPSFEKSSEIIRIAIDNGINAFDTAPEYGDSELILGKSLESESDDKKKIFFISKYPPTDWSKGLDEIIKGIEPRLRQSLNNLGITQMPIYLFHRFIDLEKEDKAILKELLRLKKHGLIKKIGVSVYTVEEAEKALEIKGIEAIQLPFNLVDKRALETGFLKKAKQKKTLLLARSVFLQGLFFKQTIPQQLSDFEPYQKKILQICREENISVGELALRYALSIDEIDSVLVGVEKKEQLLENIMMMKNGKLKASTISRINSLGSAPEHIINPSLWGKK